MLLTFEYSTNLADLFYLTGLIIQWIDLHIRIFFENKEKTPILSFLIFILLSLATELSWSNLYYDF